MAPKVQQPPGSYLLVVRMGATNFLNHLVPILRAAHMPPVTVVRPEPAPADLPDSINYKETTSRYKAGRFLRTLVSSIREARRESVIAVLSFNAVPYGIIAVLAARLAGKPAHVGFVGTDAHQLGTRWWGRFIDPLLKRGKLFTVPGDGHARALEMRGYPPAIGVLPHGIDTARFAPGEGGERDLDLLYVGRLIQTKRVGDIIMAVEELAKRGIAGNLSILGDGPERASLEEQVAARNLESLVTFHGFQTEPARWYQRARVLVLASNHEGLPFVLIEAMCSGVVPVTSAVGAIPEVVHSGSNGVVFEPGDVAGLTNALESVLTDRATYELLQAGALRLRQSAGYDRASERWDGWLESL